MPRKIKLSLEQHKQLGLQLEVARLTLMLASITIAEAYSGSATQRRHAEKALAALTTLKSTLDATVCAEFPAADNPAGAYYGRSGEAEKALVGWRRHA